MNQASNANGYFGNNYIYPVNPSMNIRKFC